MGNGVSCSRQRLTPEDSPPPPAFHPQILQVIAESGGKRREAGGLRDSVCFFFTTRSNRNTPCFRFENCHFHHRDIKLLCDYLLSSSKGKEENESDINDNNNDRNNGKSKHPMLKQLQFTRCNMGRNSAEDMEPIYDLIRSGSKSSIQSLSLSFQRLENKAFSDLFQAILQADDSNIVELKLEYTIISDGAPNTSGNDDGLYRLLSVQNGRSHLRVLSLRGSHGVLGLNGAKRIAQGLACNTTLISLNLCACGLTNDDVTSIFARLSSNSNKLGKCYSALRFLDLSYNDQLTSEILFPAAHVLQASKLESLNLSGNRRLFQQQNASVDEFVKALASKTTTLSRLELRNVGLTVSTGTLIFCSLETNSVKILDISENHHLDSRTVVPLVAHIPHWRKLQQCTLDARLCLAHDCRGNDDETNSQEPNILLALQQNTSIQVLNLRPTLVYNWWQYYHGGTYSYTHHDNNEYCEYIQRRINLVLHRNQQLALARSLIVCRQGGDDRTSTVPVGLWPDILESFSLMQEIHVETAASDEEEDANDGQLATLREDAQLNAKIIVYHILREKLPCFPTMRERDEESALPNSVPAPRNLNELAQVSRLFVRYALVACSWTYLVVDEDRGGWDMFHSFCMHRVLVLFFFALCTVAFCTICWQVLVLILENRDIPHGHKPYLYIPFIKCLFLLDYFVAGHHYAIVSLSLQGLLVAVIQALLIHVICHASQRQRPFRRWQSRMKVKTHTRTDGKAWDYRFSSMLSARNVVGCGLLVIMGRSTAEGGGRRSEIIRHCPILLWTLVVTLRALQSAL
jgi:hypothetical protein